MRPSELRKIIEPLPPGGPIHLQLTNDLRIGAGFSNAWYSSQKEHWLGWLGDYSGPGAYGRANWENRTAEFVYNHIQCAPMLVWLAEALGVPSGKLIAACEDVKAAGARSASQCGALRKAVPWAIIAARSRLVKKREIVTNKPKAIGGLGQKPARRV